MVLLHVLRSTQDSWFHGLIHGHPGLMEGAAPLVALVVT